MIYNLCNFTINEHPNELAMRPTTQTLVGRYADVFGMPCRFEPSKHVYFAYQYDKKSTALKFWGSSNIVLVLKMASYS